MSLRRELIDEWLKEYPNPQNVLAKEGLLKQLTKAVIERCLETELDSHLGYAKHGRQGNASGNTRNGTSQKTVKGELARSRSTCRVTGKGRLNHNSSKRPDAAGRL